MFFMSNNLRILNFLETPLITEKTYLFCFREDQAVEYTSIKKDLDQTTKNCRILSFKLRKAERKVEQLENEKEETKKKLAEVKLLILVMS